MRILHVNKFFDLHGGAEVYLHALIEHQLAAGHDVHAFSTRAASNLPSADNKTFVKRFDYTRSEGLARDVRKGAAYVWNREAREAMRSAIRELRPEVIHLHNVYHHLSTSILGPIRRARIPCVQTLHDYKLACPNYKMFTEGSVCERCKGGKYFEAIRHKCLTTNLAGNVLAALEMGFTKAMQAYERTIHTFICPSQFLADKMIAWGEPASKFMVVPNPVELPSRRSRQEHKTLVTILAAGRLSIEKGFDVLIRAAAQVPRVQIKIVGTGPEEDKLRRLAETLPSAQIEFLGYVPRAVETLSFQVSALAIPSVWYENAPLVVLEAMAAGLPILASRIGGLPELVEHGVNGWLIEAQKVEAWVQALEAFSQLPEHSRQELGENGRRRVLEKFTWDQHLQVLERIYNTAINPCCGDKG